MNRIEQILGEIPLGIRVTLKTLSDDTRLAIVLTLLKEGERSFSELCDVLAVPRNVLSHHLGILSQNALVNNYYAKKGDTSDYSFYSATDLLRDSMTRLFGIIEPGKSSADILSDLLFAGRRYGEGLAKLLSALYQYGEAAEIDSITLVRGENIRLPFPSKLAGKMENIVSGEG